MCHFILQNKILLVNFDLTPKQYCRSAYLTICQSHYYGHDFAAIFSSPSLSTNIIAADFVKYVENFILKIFKHKYNHIIFSFECGAKCQMHSCFTSLQIDIPNKIGGGHHKTSVKKIDLQLISPYIVSAPDNISDFTRCEFISHLKQSKALTQYDKSFYVFCDVPIYLFIGSIFREHSISIGQQHNIYISTKMTKTEITEKFKVHAESCEHQYVSVFRLCNKMTNAECCQKY